MIVIIASRYDQQALVLANRWLQRDVRLMTCHDLSLRGWQYHPTRPQKSVAVIAGQAVPVTEIAGIINRLPGIQEYEIPQIVSTDRSYVATEMTAFLCAWLNHLPCPVWNKPTANCLLGSSWRTAQWIQAAAQLGMQVPNIQQEIYFNAPDQKAEYPKDAVSATVIGDRTIGEIDSKLAQKSRELARLAQVNLLTVHFSSLKPDAVFLGAELLVDISSDVISDTIWQQLQCSQEESTS
jgi:hypothetical protein